MQHTEISLMSELHKLLVASNEKQTEDIKKEFHSKIEKITNKIENWLQKN